MRLVSVMSRSTIDAVPSGDPSSTTRISSLGSWLRTVSASRAMFSRSLYVGTMTSARSAVTPPACPEDAEGGPSGAAWSPEDVDPTTQVADGGEGATGVDRHPRRDAQP